jgi:hypothetical protein
MSDHRKMVDTATGASPPRSSTREMANSPIDFNSSSETSTSDDSGDFSTKTLQKKSNKHNVKVMNKYVLICYLSHTFQKLKYHRKSFRQTFVFSIGKTANYRSTHS